MKITGSGRAMQREKKLWEGGVQPEVTYLWSEVEEKKEIGRVFKGCSSLFLYNLEAPRLELGLPGKFHSNETTGLVFYL